MKNIRGYYILKKCHTILYIVKASVKMAEWKDIQGYPQYLISNEGQIKFKGDNDNPEMDWPIWKMVRSPYETAIINSAKSYQFTGWLLNTLLRVN